MSAFLAQNIVPKLDKALREMIYDPTKNQVYKYFYHFLQYILVLLNFYQILITHRF